MSVTTENIQLSSSSAGKLKGVLLGVGALGLAASAAGAFGADREQFYFSYLAAFAFVATIGLGLFFFTILQHLVAARWSVVVRRISETAAGGLWVLALLFLPIAVGAHDIYHHWTEPHEHIKHLIEEKEPWLNLPWFYIRAAIYLVAWGLMGRYFYKTSLAQDQSGDSSLTLRMRKYAAPCVPVFALTLTFGFIDWLMTLSPEWYSTMFGVYIFAGAFVSSVATLIVSVRVLQSMGYLNGVVTIEHFHDLGKLLFAFTVFWTYISFCQYFLIWYANLPEETGFYIVRWVEGWRPVSLFIVVGHFVLPFLALISRHPKRTPAVLGLIAMWMIIMHYVDLYWVVMPTLHEEGLHFHWLDLATVLGVGGIFFGLAAARLAKAPLVPVKDPFLHDSLEFSNV